MRSKRGDAIVTETFTSNFGALRFIWRILEPRERRRLLWLQLLALLMAVSTLGGVAAVLPFFSVLADPQAIDHHEWLSRWYSLGPFDNRRDFLLTLGLGFVTLVILANA